MWPDYHLTEVVWFINIIEGIKGIDWSALQGPNMSITGVVSAHLTTAPHMRSGPIDRLRQSLAEAPPGASIKHCAVHHPQAFEGANRGFGPGIRMRKTLR
ncbi:hypothetical protein DVT68_06630 [Dyella solisilvae]|uniref:Uncharacterized protein n=1 Tax=Dyella solisilvae TaxID=1920168 RepID=A0A370KCT8_9GAMM|nr:hypothetical protein [Dyella solisilvae]RDJ00465.1 hypothetical protein DVT68_06630 [Dyella solisilvae]